MSPSTFKIVAPLEPPFKLKSPAQFNTTSPFTVSVNVPEPVLSNNSLEDPMPDERIKSPPISVVTVAVLFIR